MQTDNRDQNDREYIMNPVNQRKIYEYNLKIFVLRFKL